MSEFKIVKKAINKQYTKMSKGEMFKTDVSKDVMWDTYIASFKEGTNELHRERTEHDCNCCKRFIRACGSTVAIKNNKLVSIWDVKVNACYQPVVDALSALVKAQVIRDIFLSSEKNLGTDYSIEKLTLTKWEHFHFTLPEKFVKEGAIIGTALAKAKSNNDVFKRGLIEITVDAFETVLELISQNSIYRGAENREAVKSLFKHKKAFDKIESESEKDNYCWLNSLSRVGKSKTRNSMIGTLLVDISEGKPLDEAVRMYESKAAPQNYKRPSALITKSMIAKAQKKVEELGIGAALVRRFATIDDITINNILFANRDAKKVMSVFDEMAKEVQDKPKKLSKIEEVSIEQFVKDILPNVDDIKMLVENKHQNNFMSLISPEDKEAASIFKWHNNFSWAYNGEVADSMKERVKKAGGRVDGVLRFSIQWNDGDNNPNDFDAHCIEPNGNLIHFPSKGKKHPSSGVLDVDIINPGNKVAVENITWSDIHKMLEGKYKFIVHNYSHNGGRTGFTAEIEYAGQIYTYVYDKQLRQGEKVTVAELKFTKADGITFTKSLPSTHASKEVWGVTTEKMHKVSVVMNSPNHWDGNETGNKHYFFMLEECKNDEKARGFFNEFLKEELNEHRKVFEVLGSKMKTERSEEQLSGLGFSSTQRNSVVCNVTGAFNRTIKIKF